MGLRLRQVECGRWGRLARNGGRDKRGGGGRKWEARLLGDDAARSASCIVRMTTAAAEGQDSAGMQAVSKIDEVAG